MPKRLSVRRLDSLEVQGDDSWVVIKYPTVEFMRQTLLDKPDAEQNTRVMFDFGVKLIQEHVLDWNWVDDDGNPLPTPKNDPDAVRQLTSMELQWLASQLTPKDKEGEKNSSGS